MNQPADTRPVTITRNPTGRGTTITVAGHDISHITTAARLTLDATGAHVLTVDLHPGATTADVDAYVTVEGPTRTLLLDLGWTPPGAHIDTEIHGQDVIDQLAAENQRLRDLLEQALNEAERLDAADSGRSGPHADDPNETLTRIRDALTSFVTAVNDERQARAAYDQAKADARTQLADLNRPADAVITDDNGRLAVTWPYGRGNTLVHPEAIEGWAHTVNQLRDQLAAQTTLTGHLSDAAATITNQNRAYERTHEQLRDLLAEVVKLDDDGYLLAGSPLLARIRHEVATSRDTVTGQ